MSTEQLKNAVAAAGQPKQVATLPALLEKMKPQLALALPKHMNADRMVRIAVTELRKNPKLMQCEQTSVMAAVVIGSQLGLEPGINGQAYLIPYEDKRKGITTCTFVPGWKGLVDLAQRSGRSSVWTGAVFEGDEFEFEYGTSPYLKHKPGPNSGNPKFLQCVYAVGRVKGADFPVLEVWSMDKVWHHRDRFNKVGTRHYSYEHPEMYARKVALLQVLKYMPQSIELSTAMALDNTAEVGRQALNLNDAIDGTVIPAATDEPEQEPEKKREPIDESTAIERFKAAKSADEVTGIWQDVVASYGAGDIPIAIEAARNTFRDLLTEKAAAAKGGAK